MEDLVSVTLSNLTVWYLLLFEMPKCVGNELEKTQKDSIWDGSWDKKKIYLVRWEEIFKSEDERFGFSQFLKKEWALLCKLTWRFGMRQVLCGARCWRQHMRYKGWEARMWTLRQTRMLWVL